MKCFFLINCLFLSVMSYSQQVIPLYNSGIPNSVVATNEEREEIIDKNVLIIHDVQYPVLTAYFPKKEIANGTAVLICPGGGYSIVAAGHEGADIAKKFNQLGVTAFVLKYRIPNKKWMIHLEIGPLQDVQQALQLIHSNAGKWNIKPNKIGIMGFSAGGHLASTAATHFNKNYIDNGDNANNLRPDFQILIYPVISFTDSIGHIGSRDQLIGKNPSAEMVKEYSNELQVTENSPPCFMVHAQDDGAVKVQNCLVYYEALQKNKVPVEMHLFPKGGHGFGSHRLGLAIDSWFQLLENWMKERDLLKKG